MWLVGVYLEEALRLPVDRMQTAELHRLFRREEQHSQQCS